MQQRIVPNLWFDTEAEEAADLSKFTEAISLQISCETQDEVD